MDNINEFKSFVKKHPNLNSYVTDGQMTWQKFYEMYDMYGEDSEVWQSYKTKERKTTSLTDIVNMAKNVDVDKLQDGIGSLQKAITLFSDLFLSKDTEAKSTYKLSARQRLLKTESANTSVRRITMPKRFAEWLIMSMILNISSRTASLRRSFLNAVLSSNTPRSITFCLKTTRATAI